ncbi:MAG: hypothetical protein ACYC6Y_09405 [Thermoguttaceae bacterium]
MLMADLWRILMAAMLGVHLTVGCCLHHAHACEENGGARSFEGHGDPGEDRPEGATNHSHHGPGDCQGIRCSAVFSKSALGNSMIPPWATCSTALRDDPYRASGIDRQQRAAASGRQLLPVRLHLVHQVLLI